MSSMYTRRKLPSWPRKERSPLRVAFLVVLLCSIVTGAIGNVTPASASPFTNPAFRQNWQQADYPVAIGAVTRGFTWGVEPFYSTTEPYAESPGGSRQVEYLDKARMEITRPDFNPSQPYYVTNGLIVKEMVSGLLQVGDNSFKQRFPAFDVPVAGDPVEINPEAPTYASFYALNNFYKTIPQTPITTTSTSLQIGFDSHAFDRVLADTPVVTTTTSAATTPSGTTPASTTPAVTTSPSVSVSPGVSVTASPTPVTPGQVVPPGSGSGGSTDLPYPLAFGLLEKQPDRTNEQVITTLNRSGQVGINSILGRTTGATYVYWERTLGHNIPKVFWDFLNQTGPIFNGVGLVQGKVVDWVKTMGYPITDAYWVRTNVKGVPTDVLVQLYERRILTFTPSNPAGYEVEMGNVGRHYYNWRYNPKYNLTMPLQSNTEVKPEAGFPGTTFSIRVYRMVQDEDIATTIYTPNGQPLVGSLVTGTVPTGFTFFPLFVRTDLNVSPGLYTIVFKGQLSGNEAKAYFFVLGIPGYSLPA